MATTLNEPPKTEVRRLPTRPEAGNSGNGGWRNLVPSDGDLRVVEEYSPPPSSSAIWVGIAAITMSFAAFTSALIVRQGSSTDWRHITLPAILYLSTLLLIIRSFTLEISRRRVATFMAGLTGQVATPGRWLYVTLPLGFLFLACHDYAWLRLWS